jgi:hypothetical protein
MTKRTQNVRLGWRVAGTSELASAAIPTSSDDALETKAPTDNVQGRRLCMVSRGGGLRQSEMWLWGV